MVVLKNPANRFSYHCDICDIRDIRDIHDIRDIRDGPVPGPVRSGPRSGRVPGPVGSCAEHL